nr:hypothetical protein [Tanacetum cinerariifolium]
MRSAKSEHHVASGLELESLIEFPARPTLRSLELLLESRKSVVWLRIAKVYLAVARCFVVGSFTDQDGIYSVSDVRIHIDDSMLLNSFPCTSACSVWSLVRGWCDSKLPLLSSYEDRDSCGQRLFNRFLRLYALEIDKECKVSDR